MSRADQDPADQLFGSSEGLVDDGRRLREVSNQLMEHIEELRTAERRSRTVPIGSREFAALSADVTALSHALVRLSVEQEAVSRMLPPEAASIDDLEDRDQRDAEAPFV